MKRKILTIAISILSIMSSCDRKHENNKDTELNNILSKYEQPDNTKKIIKSQYYYQRFDTWIHYITYYDEYDNIILKKVLDNNGDISEMSRISYYEEKDGKIEEIGEWFSYKDSIENVVNYIRNDKGNLLQITGDARIIYNIGATSFEYDETGKKIKECSENEFTVFTYLDSGLDKKVIKYDYYKYDIPSDRNSTYTRIRTEYKTFNVKTDKVIQIDVYEYDEQGELSRFIEYNYEYDQHGNNISYSHLARSKCPPFITIPRNLNWDEVDEYKREYNRNMSLKDFDYIVGQQRLYLYDKHGNLTKEFVYELPKKTLYNTITYDYEYDKDGNWIKRIQKFVSQPENEITEGDKEIREIIYL